MPFLKGKFARSAAATLSATALVVAIAAPNSAFGQAITLRRSCNDSDASCIATSQRNLSVPIAAQLSAQHAVVTPSVASSQSNDLDQTADNSNRGIAADILAQNQSLSQSGGDQSSDLSNHQDVDSRASTGAWGGTTIAVGPNAHIDFSPSQSADASANGDATATSSTGQGGGNGTASGDIGANGGNASGSGAAPCR